MDKKKSEKMSIVTWNINGIRSFSPAEFKNRIDSFDADIICVQETKITEDYLDEKIAFIEGYQSFFSFSKARSGYSGVATFCRINAVPIRAEEGLSGILVPPGCTDAVGTYGIASKQLSTREKKNLDAEGRAVITQHLLNGGGLLTIINVYCPRIDPEQPNRLEYKLQFYEQMLSRAQALQCDAGSFVLLMGDLNCVHRPIDSCDPGDMAEFHANPIRQMLALVLQENAQGSAEDVNKIELKLVDTYRHLHPHTREAYTCWNTMTGARENNYGTRIDYILCDSKLATHLSESKILSHVMGSDHCPVQASFRLPECITPAQPPSLCIKFLSRFSGTQKNLQSFLQPKSQAQKINNTTNASNNSKCTKRKQTNIKEFFRNVSKEKILRTVTDPPENSQVQCDVWEKWTSTEQQVVKNKPDNVDAWKAILGGPPPAPLCKHKEKCVIKTSKKPGPNLNRQFYSCKHGIGPASNPDSNCGFFEWIRK